MIVHVVYNCTPDVFAGGVAKMVLELATAQSAFRKVVICAYASDQRNEVRINDNLHIKYFRGSKFLDVVYSTEICRYLIAEKERILVIHAHNTFHPLNRQVSKVAASLCVPIFFHPHGALDPVLFRGFSIQNLKKMLYVRLVELRNLNQSTGVFALTALEKIQLLSIGVKKPIYVVPNGISFASTPSEQIDTTSLIAAQEIPNDSQKILYVGRIAKKKGLHFILPAFAAVKNRLSNAYLLLAGDENQNPVYSRQLRRMASDLGIASSVKWLGFLDEKKKPIVFASSQVFVHASSSEGMAMAILESMDRMVPVVATYGCYMGDAAREGALLECEQTPDSLAEMLLRVLQCEQVSCSLKKNAKQYLQDHHDWKVIAAKINSLYGS